MKIKIQEEKEITINLEQSAQICANYLREQFNFPAGCWIKKRTGWYLCVNKDVYYGSHLKVEERAIREASEEDSVILDLILEVERFAKE